MKVARLAARHRRIGIAPERRLQVGALDGGVRGVGVPRRQEPTMDELIRSAGRNHGVPPLPFHKSGMARRLSPDDTLRRIAYSAGAVSRSGSLSAAGGRGARRSLQPRPEDDVITIINVRSVEAMPIALLLDSLTLWAGRID